MKVVRKWLATANLHHGHARKGKKSGTYWSWHNMKRRCNDPNNTAYHNYGGRGITVCDRWLNFESFLEDMGERPEGLMLDRINNDLGYFKGNCRWATRIQQNRNNRRVRLGLGQAVQIAKRILKGESQRLIARDYGFPEHVIWAIGRGETWPDAYAKAASITFKKGVV